MTENQNRLLYMISLYSHAAQTEEEKEEWLVVDPDRQVEDQGHHHQGGHRQLLEVDVDQTLQLDHYLQQITVILTTRTIVSIVKVWD